MSAVTVDTETSSIRCHNCSELIPAQAKQCTHCDAYQDWRRHIPLSSTVLSLLVALFAVLGTTIPVLVKTFDTEDATLRASLVWRDTLPIQHGDAKDSITDKDVFQLAVSNDGTGVAIVTSVLVWYELHPREKEESEGENVTNEALRLPWANVTRQDYKVKPKDSVILPFYTDPSVMAKDGHVVQYLRVYYVNSKHERKELFVPFPRPGA